MNIELLVSLLGLYFLYKLTQCNSCRVSVSRKLHCKLGDTHTHTQLRCCSGSENYFCKIQYVNPFAYSWDDDYEYEEGLLSQISNVYKGAVSYINSLIVEKSEWALGSLTSKIFPAEPTVWGRIVEFARAYVPFFSPVMDLMEDLQIKSAEWLEEDMTKATELMVLLVTLFVILAAVFRNLRNIKPIYNNIQDSLSQAKNLRPLMDDINIYQTRKNGVDKLIYEIDDFQTGVKRMVVKQHLAVMLLNNRVKLLNGIFRGVDQPNQMNDFFDELKGKAQMTVPSEREIID